MVMILVVMDFLMGQLQQLQAEGLVHLLILLMGQPFSPLQFFLDYQLEDIRLHIETLMDVTQQKQFFC